MKFRKHIPSFVDSREENDSLHFSSKEELLNSEWMKRFTDAKDFNHFAQDGNCILAVSDEGFRWWVVGYVDAQGVFPKWEGWKFRAVLDGKECVLSSEVVSSCGGELTLKCGKKPYKV